MGTNLSNIFRSGVGPHRRVPNGTRLYCLFPSVVERRLVAALQSLHEVTPMTVLGFLSLTHLVLTVGLGILDRFHRRESSPFASDSLRAKDCKCSRSPSGIEIFKRDLKFQASHPPNPFFFVGYFEGQDWKFQARLKFSSEIENFKRDLVFFLFLSLGP